MFILETDANFIGLGAILSQDDGEIHPVAPASRSLDTHEENYGISELETLGFVWAVKYFCPYILGNPCSVYTDHSACLSISPFWKACMLGIDNTRDGCDNKA